MEPTSVSEAASNIKLRSEAASTVEKLDLHNLKIVVK